VRTLSELQGRDPLILTLAHGNYCPRRMIPGDLGFPGMKKRGSP
jgi:hypothetical protein